MGGKRIRLVDPVTGEPTTPHEVARASGVSPDAIYFRIRNGLDVFHVGRLSSASPTTVTVRHPGTGEPTTVKEICDLTGVCDKTIRDRVSRNSPRVFHVGTMPHGAFAGRPKVHKYPGRFSKMRIKDIASELGVHISTVHKWLRNGRLSEYC